MNLSNLFILHAIITFAAGVVLIVAPEQIPETVSIRIDKSAYLICYLLGSAELALAFLSFHSRKISDSKSLRLISLTFMVFHVSTAAVELYVFLQGGSIRLWLNIALRLIIALLFAYLGVYKIARHANKKQIKDSFI